MARFDVHSMRDKDAVYVVDVQSDLLSDLATRAVIPLIPVDVGPKPIGDLNPAYEVHGKRYVLLTQAIASVPRTELKRTIASFAEHRDSITRALDTLFIGF